MDNESSYYHFQHCREEACIEICCPCCGLGNPESDSLFIDFFSWLNVHRAGKAYLLQNSSEPYLEGYIKACNVIDAELKRLIEEHKDGSDRIGRDKDTLG